MKELFQAAWDAGGLPTPAHLVKNKRPPRIFLSRKNPWPKKDLLEQKFWRCLHAERAEPPAHLSKNDSPQIFLSRKNPYPKKLPRNKIRGGVCSLTGSHHCYHQRHSIAPIHPAWAKVPETRHAPSPPWRFQGLHNGRKAGNHTTQYKPEMRWYGRVRKGKSCASWGFLTVKSMKSVVFLRSWALLGDIFLFWVAFCFFKTLHLVTRPKTTQSGLFKDLRSTRIGAAFPAKA